MNRRLLKYLAIGTGLVAFTGYFAFSTFLFNPLEGEYEFDLANLVPRDVDLFVGKSALAEEFGRFPELEFGRRLARTERGQRLLQSTEWSALTQSLGIDPLLAQLEQALARLPVAVDPLAVAGGRELAFAAYANGQPLPRSEWALYLRTNWLGKLGVELLESPDLLGLGDQGLVVEQFDRSVRLSGGELRQPLHVTRLRDVLVIATTERLGVAALDLFERQGQDSLGQSAAYYDHVSTVVRDEDELRVAVDYADAAGSFGWPLESPRLNHPEPLQRFLAQLFQFQLVRELTGVVGFRRGLSLQFEGEFSTDALTPLQKRLYRQRDADQAELGREVARLVPADSAVFGYVDGDFEALLDAFLKAAEPALRSNLESEVVRPVFGHDTVEQWIAELGSAVADRVALVVRPNDYPLVDGDPPNNGQTVFAWAVVLWVVDGERLTQLQNKIESNQGRLGIRGAEVGSQGVFTHEVRGGTVVREYWAPLVPGTGHLSSVRDRDVLIVSNHYRLLEQMIAVYYSTPGAQRPLSERGEFQSLMAAGLPSAALTLWVDPRSLSGTLLALAEQGANDDAFRDFDWDTKRRELEREVLTSRFPGEVPGALTPGVQSQLDALVDEEIERFRIQHRGQIVPALVERARGRLDALELVKCALLQLRLEQKDLSLAARFLLPLDEP
jgi:hypothetical protein